MAQLNNRVLIIEDDLIQATQLKRMLEQLNYQVLEIVSTQASAIEAADALKPNWIISDISLSVGTGVAAISEIQKRHRIPVIYVTAYSDESTLASALATSPYGYIVKPYTLDTLQATLKVAQIRYKLDQNSRASKARLEAIVEKVDDPANVAMRVTDNSASFDYETIDSLRNATGHSTSMSLAALNELLQIGEVSPDYASISNESDIEQLTFVFNADDESSEPLRIIFNGIRIHEQQVTVESVTDLSAAEREGEQEDFASMVFESVGEGVAIVSDQGEVTQVNHRLEEMLGFDQKELKQFNFLNFLTPKARLAFKNGETDSAALKTDIRMVSKEGKAIDVKLTFTPMLSLDNSRYALLSVSDITELRRAEETISKLAYRDSLTQCFNRNYLSTVIDKPTNQPFVGKTSVIAIDMDGLKLINDSYGTTIGDRYIQSAARRIGSALKRKEKLFRTGSDEFVILTRACDTETELEQTVTNIVRQVNRWTTIDDVEIDMSCCIGYIFNNESDAQLTDLLLKADIALNTAKQQGEASVSPFLVSSQKEIEYSAFVEHNLKRAILENQIVAYYQPIYDRDKKIVAIEVLARWFDQETGMIPNDKYIPILEKGSRIQAFGQKILRDACLTKSMLNKFGFGDLVFHVNVSKRELAYKNYARNVIDCLREFSLKPHEIILEVTESIVSTQAVDIMMQDLLNFGVNFALDDFGMGYSTISDLHRELYPVIKLDKTLIGNGLGHDNKAQVAQSMVDLCSRLNKITIAEGIETEQHFEFCLQHNVDLFQGYLFAKPMSYVRLLELLDVEQEQQDPSERSLSDNHYNNG